jgi:hypothetical protein
MIFEVHVTNPSSKLEGDWKQLEIILEKGDTPHQPMYSKYFNKENLLELTQELRYIKAERVKIERHDKLPQFIEWPEYYEYHIKVHDNNPDVYVKDIGGKISRNAQQDGKFITLREDTSKLVIDYKFWILQSRLEDKGYKTSNIQKELVVYDSNISMDKGW